MNKIYCDICGQEVTGMSILDNADAMRFRFYREFVHFRDTEQEVTLCPNCSEALYYYLGNRKVFRSVVNKMTIMNRIRFLFKLPLRDGEQDDKR